MYQGNYQHVFWELIQTDPGVSEGLGWLCNLLSRQSRSLVHNLDDSGNQKIEVMKHVGILPADGC